MKSKNILLIIGFALLGRLIRKRKKKAVPPAKKVNSFKLSTIKQKDVINISGFDKGMMY